MGKLLSWKHIRYKRSHMETVMVAGSVKVDRWNTCMGLQKGVTSICGCVLHCIPISCSTMQVSMFVTLNHIVVRSFFKKITNFWVHFCSRFMGKGDLKEVYNTSVIQMWHLNGTGILENFYLMCFYNIFITWNGFKSRPQEKLCVFLTPLMLALPYF